MTKKRSPTQNQRDADGEWEQWLATRPPHVARVARQFPPGVVLEHAGETLYLLGYNETDTDAVMLIFSTINPFEDYEAARRLMEHKRYVCSHHLTPMTT